MNELPTIPLACGYCGMQGYHAPDCPEHNDPVNHPRHYTTHPSGLECIQISRHLTSDVGQAVQYVWRSEDKNGDEDLAKAAWYLSDALAFDDPMFLPNRRGAALSLIGQVMAVETGWRHAFFDALLELDLEAMLEAVEELRAGSPVAWEV